MSKRQLLQFIKELERSELEEQIVDLYSRFKEVKTYYDFSFNPKEDKIYLDAKQRIGKEYFPEGRRKAKKRRSVAQKLFVKLIKLEFNPELLADLMLFNIEVAQTYNQEKPIKQEAFYQSMLKSFRHALVYINAHGYQAQYLSRIERIIALSQKQKWLNVEGFLIAKRELLT